MVFLSKVIDEINGRRLLDEVGLFVAGMRW